jgi:hypothetical protein
MVSTPNPEGASFLSTSVVSRALGLDANGVRAMIEIGTLPEPQWITFGSRVERIYSLEWLMLAREQLNSRRLTGLEHAFDPTAMVQFVLRFERADWTLEEITQKLVALNELWKLCARTLSSDDDVATPTLNVRRLSAGSPLDLLAWVSQNWGGIVGTGGLASLFIYVIRNPEKVADAIPRALAAWREQWARADDAAVRQLDARLKRRQFESDAAELLKKIGAVPSDSALSGDGTTRFEISAPDNTEDVRALEPSEDERDSLPRPDQDGSGK